MGLKISYFHMQIITPIKENPNNYLQNANNPRPAAKYEIWNSPVPQEGNPDFMWDNFSVWSQDSAPPRAAWPHPPTPLTDICVEPELGREGRRKPRNVEGREHRLLGNWSGIRLWSFGVFYKGQNRGILQNCENSSLVRGSRVNICLKSFLLAMVGVQQPLRSTATRGFTKPTTFQTGFVCVWKTSTPSVSALSRDFPKSRRRGELRAEQSEPCPG